MPVGKQLFCKLQAARQDAVRHFFLLESWSRDRRGENGSGGTSPVASASTEHDVRKEGRDGPKRGVVQLLGGGPYTLLRLDYLRFPRFFSFWLLLGSGVRTQLVGNCEKQR